MGARKALFLDRDGVINIDHGYVGCLERFHFVEGIFPLILAAQAEGYLPIVVTNQSGIGRGYYSQEDFEELTRYMIERMREAGIAMTREQVFYCPHTPEEGCVCRKPQPGMFLEAKERFGLDMTASWMIGDKLSDIEAARAAGVGHRVLIRPNQSLSWKELNGF